MKQIFHHYEKWEDYLNGMYVCNYSKEDETQWVQKSIELLSNQELFFKTGLEMINSWKNSADVNLTNLGCNRRAWIGQASCCYNHKAPESVTRLAWGLMDDYNRFHANNTADKLILIYEKQDKGLYKNMGEQMLF